MTDQNPNGKKPDLSEIGANGDPLHSEQSLPVEPFEVRGDPDGLPDSLLPSPKRLAIVASCLIFGLFITLGVAVQMLNAAFGIWFTEVFIFLGVAWVLVRFSGRDPPRYVRISFPGWRPVLFGFALGSVNFFAIVVPIQVAAQSIAPSWMREQFDVTHLFQTQRPAELAAMIAGVGIAAPFCEEFVFRGVLQQGLMPPAMNARRAIAFSALIFSAFHLDPVGFAARVELGVLFGVLYWRTGTIWPGAMAHAANNLVSTGIYFAAQDGGAPPDTQPSWTLVLLLGAIGNLLLLWLISMARSHPSLLQVSPTGDRPAASRVQRSLFSLGLPWIAAALGSLLLLGLTDPRGVALSLYDRAYQLPPTSQQASADERAARDELQTLRSEARRGQIPVQAYVQRRKELAERLRKQRPDR